MPPGNHLSRSLLSTTFQRSPRNTIHTTAPGYGYNALANQFFNFTDSPSIVRYGKRMVNKNTSKLTTHRTNCLVARQTIVVDKNGTELAYLDSGPPSSRTIYTTIFAVHGITFTSRLFYHYLLLASPLMFHSSRVSEGL
jgi:hypothetical protein